MENKFSDLATIASDVLVNPFLQFPLDNLSLQSPKIQSSAVFFSKFEQHVSLTPMTQGIHLPNSIYNYMEQNFFQWICTEVSNYQ